MVHVFLARVFNEEDIGNEAVEPVANPDAVFVGLPVEVLLHQSLRAVFGFQVVEPVSLRQEEMLAHVLGMNTKDTLHDTIVDVGLGIEFATERQPEVFYLANGQR